jgi:hypothetical protein
MLGVHKIPFLEFSPILPGLSIARFSNLQLFESRDAPLAKIDFWSAVGSH